MLHPERPTRLDVPAAPQRRRSIHPLRAVILERPQLLRGRSRRRPVHWLREVFFGGFGDDGECGGCGGLCVGAFMAFIAFIAFIGSFWNVSVKAGAVVLISTCVEGMAKNSTHQTVGRNFEAKLLRAVAHL